MYLCWSEFVCIHVIMCAVGGRFVVLFVNYVNTFICAGVDDLLCCLFAVGVPVVLFLCCVFLLSLLSQTTAHESNKNRTMGLVDFSSKSEGR